MTIIIGPECTDRSASRKSVSIAVTSVRLWYGMSAFANLDLAFSGAWMATITAVALFIVEVFY